MINMQKPTALFYFNTISDVLNEMEKYLIFNVQGNMKYLKVILSRHMEELQRTAWASVEWDVTKHKRTEKTRIRSETAHSFFFKAS